MIVLKKFKTNAVKLADITLIFHQLLLPYLSAITINNTLLYVYSDKQVHFYGKKNII